MNPLECRLWVSEAGVRTTLVVQDGVDKELRHGEGASVCDAISKALGSSALLYATQEDEYLLCKAALRGLPVRLRVQGSRVRPHLVS